MSDAIGNRNRMTPRSAVLPVFAFVFAATLAFLGMRGSDSTSARADLSGFNAGNIISDAVMSDYNSMSEADIYNFLVTHNSKGCRSTNFAESSYWEALGHTFFYSTDHSYLLCLADITLNGESAPHIIWSAAQYYRINPKVLLVTLEKEMSLVTDGNPAVYNLDRATGYGCPDHANGACADSDSGFKNQVYGAAWLYRHVLDTNESGYPAGSTVNILYHPYNNCGTKSVYIENRATAALYRYTPYVPNTAALNWGDDGCSAFGNRNFYAYFTEWFGSTQGNNTSDYLPEGTYQIQTTAGKSISFESASHGSVAILADSSASDTLQQFEAIKDGDYYRFKNVKTGYYLDLTGAVAYAGTRLELWQGNNTCAQKWLVERNENGFYLASGCSYSSVIDIWKDAYNTAGSIVEVWAREYSLAQTFVFTAIGNGAIEDGTYAMKSAGDKLLVPTNFSSISGTRATLWENVTSNAAYFDFKRQSDGYYTIKNNASGLYLATENANKSNGVYIILNSNADSCTAKWGVDKFDSGYRLVNACSGKSLDIYGGGTQVSTNGARISTWESNTSNAQSWTLVPFGSVDQEIADGEYRLSNIASPSLALTNRSSSAAVATKSSSNDAQNMTISYDKNTGNYFIKSTSGTYLSAPQPTSNGVISVFSSSSDSCNARWVAVSRGNNTYNFFSSCFLRTLDASGISPSNGATVTVHDFNGGNNQKWHLEDPNQKQIIDDGVYILESAVGNGGFVLDVWGAAAPRAGTNVQIYPKHGGSTQRFQLTYDQSDDSFSLVSQFSHTGLDANGAVAYNGTNIQVWPANSSCAQKFRITAIDNTYYRLASLCNESYSLDVNGATARAEVNVQLWSNNSSAAQKWKFISVE